MLTLVQEWGPGSLLALVIILLLMGQLIPSKSAKRLLAEKEEIIKQKQLEYDNMKAYYEDRIKDLKEIHSEITTNLRVTADIAQAALTQSVRNVTRLTGIVDEYAELTRVVTPALVAARNVLEGPSDDQS